MTRAVGPAVLEAADEVELPNNAARSMALGAILVVAVSVLASASLLPALVRQLGSRAVRHRRLRRRGSGSFWPRWTAGVMRRPLLATLLSGGALLALSIPMLSMQTGSGRCASCPRIPRPRPASRPRSG